jgi:long-chain acyl-CoA synthetase
MTKSVIVLLALCVSATTLAAEVGGVKLDDKVSVGGRELVLNGAGIRTRVMFKVYVASLYLPQRSADPSAVLAAGPRRIQMNLLRNLSPDQLVDALVEGLSENNSAQEMAAVKSQTDQLVAIMKAFKEVKEKDVVTLDFVDGGTKVSLNGEPRGTIPGEPFNKALTKIWLGDKPVQGDLKKAMLGG